MRRSLRKRPSRLRRSRSRLVGKSREPPLLKKVYKNFPERYVCYVRKSRAFQEGVGPRIENVDYFGTREYFSRRKSKESLGEKFRWGGEVIGC